MKRLVVLLTIASASGTVIESQIVPPAASKLAVAKEDTFECDKDLTGFVIDGKDFTDVLKTVCKVWTTVPQFGEFPGKNVSKLSDMFNSVMKEGGLYDDLKSKFNKANEDYCLRQEVTRKTMLYTASENECPPIVTEEILESMPWLIEEADHNDDDPEPDEKKLLTGEWTCEMQEGGQCNCKQRYITKRTSEPFPMVSIASRPRGCEMVHNGICYGDCPEGFRPTWLKGWFRPVCTSVCAATNHPVTCGVGCAATRGKCVERILKQVKAVALSASKVAAFVIAGPAGLTVAETVANVVKIAEFAFNTLTSVLEAVDLVYKMYTREQANMATVVAIFQVVKDESVTFIGNWNMLSQTVSASAKLFMTLIDANFQWKNLNIGWIANTIMEHGGAALKAAFDLAKEFAFKACALASQEVHFTVESVGDDRIIGPWQRLGSANGKPRYALVGDTSNTRLEWNSRRKSWSFWVMDRSFGRGWWWGWAGFGWRELYETKSATAEFPKSGWNRIEGPLPLPENVDAKNGGK